MSEHREPGGSDRVWGLLRTRLLEWIRAEELQRTGTSDTYNKALIHLIADWRRVDCLLVLAVVIKDICLRWADARELGYFDALKALYQEVDAMQPGDGLVPGSFTLARELLSAAAWWIDPSRRSTGDAEVLRDALLRASGGNFDTTFAVCNDLVRLGLTAVLLFALDHGMDAIAAFEQMRREVDQAK